MYPVRETKTSRLRASGGPAAHALEHVGKSGAGTRPRLSGGQAPRKGNKGLLKASSELVVPKSHSVENLLTEGEGQSNCHGCMERDLTINELEMQLAERNLDLQATKAGFNELIFSLEEANSKAKQDAARIKELEDRLAKANAKEERQVQAEAELKKESEKDKQVLSSQQQRILELEQELQKAKQTIASLQQQQKEATVQIEKGSRTEARLSQEVTRMQQELESERLRHFVSIGKLQNDLEQNKSTIVSLRRRHESAVAEIKDLREIAQSEAQLRQDVSNLREKLRSSEDSLKKFQDKEQAEQREKEAKKPLLSQAALDLAAKDEEFAVLCRTLNEEQQKATSYELDLKLLQEEANQYVSTRSVLEHQIGTLKSEVVRHKLDVRRYAEIIVGNEGEPFYEVLEERRDAKASKEVPLPRGQHIVRKSAQTRLSHGQEPAPGSSMDLIFEPKQQPKQLARHR